jgi:hypothetical protein
VAKTNNHSVEANALHLPSVETVPVKSTLWHPSLLFGLTEMTKLFGFAPVKPQIYLTTSLVAKEEPSGLEITTNPEETHTISTSPQIQTTQQLSQDRSPSNTVTAIGISFVG